MKRKIAMVMTVVSLLALAGGCSSGKQQNTASNKLRYWLPLNSQLNSLASNLGETPFGQELQKATGTEIEFIHSNSSDQFALMLSSGDMPDIIEADWATYNGGPEKSIADGYIMNLNDVMKDKAPNIKVYLKEHPEIDKMVKMDEGNYYVFPFIRGDEELLVSTGPIVRKDWLDDLGMELPETMDDWHTMLTRFKNEKGASTPLSFMNYSAMFNYGAFIGAYGINNTFFVQDKTIHYGPMESGYKEFLQEMSKWYQEGLLDANFMSVDSKALDSSILNGKTGATVAGLGGGIGKYMGVAPDDKFDLCGTTYPVKNKGDRPMFSARQNQYSGFGAAISKNCKNVDLAAKVLDYNYSKEGTMLNNFGIEGESYEMVDGYPKYTELITKNPEGLAMANVMSKYVRSNWVGAFVQDKRYIEQYSSLPQQQEALKLWMDTDAEQHILPTLAFSSDQSSELADIMSTITTYQDEQMVKFIMGTRSIDEFDDYVNEMKKMGIEKAIEIYQAAYDTYDKN